MGAAQGPAHPHCRHVYVHFRPKVPDHYPQGGPGPQRVDYANKMGAGEGRRRLRMPSVHAADQQLRSQAQCRR